MKRITKIMALLLALVMVLAACGQGTEKAPTEDGKEQTTDTTTGETADGEEEETVEHAFPTEVTHDGDVLPDGEGMLKVGLVSGSPFKGLFSSVLYQGQDDSSIMAPTMWGTFMSDGDFKIRKGGPVDFDADPEAKTITLTIVKDYKWHNGQPVTAKDFAYAYEIIGHGEYTGPRYGSDYQNVVGIEEYHFGTMTPEEQEDYVKSMKEGNPDFVAPTPATTISGLNIVDEKTLVITFKEFGVDMLWGSGVPYEPVPYEQLKDIAIKDLESSDAIRVNPWSCGPYYMSNVVPGEKIEFEANEHFWNGKAHIPKVLMTVINSDKVPASMAAGEFDYYTALPSSKYEEVKDLQNFTLLGETNLSYSYLGFKLGKWDATKGENVYNPDGKMANLNLRKAMECSVDINALGESYMNGLSYRGSTIIPTPFKNFHDFDLKPVEYDMDRANQLLDEAGYKDVDGDGMREDPNGQPLVINVASMSGSETNEKLAAYYIQQWKEIGLNAQLTQGRLLEFNNFYDLVEADAEDIDVFFAGWNTGSNPECYGLYGKNAFWNFSRYANDEFEAMLKKLKSVEAFDDAYRTQAYKDVQRHIYENVPVAITYYSYGLTPVNKRVKFYDVGYDDGTKPFWSWADLQLTAPEPIKN